MAVINNTNNYKCWQECRGKGTLIAYWWQYELVQPLWKAVVGFIKTQK
jgi:hypothetical protein